MKIILWIALSLVVLFLLWFVFGYVGWFNGYSDGERTGEIYKFSKKGLIWKSWEGEMYLGGVSDEGKGLVLDKFHFSIPESQEAEKLEVIEAVKLCAKERRLCTITYKQWFKAPITQSSKYTVEAVD